MADHSLAHRAQNPTRTESVHLPPSAAPTNHGRTLAAWTTTWVVVAGGLVAALAVVFAVVWLFWVGLGICLLGIVLGLVLRGAGHGQGGAKTLERQARTGGH
ncbi:HGxxPAAW family protein [Cellulomonas alba]|uniref:HGxxPAAW family protein n=1 Tax=Cellulomonas alba TaxID=3053467 RepID=A0ABT7SLC9_9CELL|nr:HGxxPAAW family protein [Cellulomonas alba]MDM7856367.1 HGxxPAAW family protein [Cellulomonas alba]